jgi:catechol 2,3-dioxygenase-like lactoylglutathione lyase family enzyme
MTDPKFRYAVLPVADVAASAAFYGALGCHEKGRDGERWSEVRSDYVAISLCGPGDMKRPPGPAFAVMVDDLAATVARLTELGGVVETPASGPMAMVKDPDGNLVMLVEPTS